MRMVVQTAGERHAAACWNRYLWRQQGRASARPLPLRFGRARAPVRDRGNTSWASVSVLFAIVMGYFRFSQLIRPVDDCVDGLFGLSYHVLSSAGSFWHSGNQKSVLRGFIISAAVNCVLNPLRSFLNEHTERVAEISPRMESSLPTRHFFT